MSNERPDGIPTVSCAREELGIGADEVVFVNASPAAVIAAETQEAWARVLATVPGSLLAVAPFAGREATEALVVPFVSGFEQVLARHGVDDQRLIVFLKDLPSRADVRAFLRLGNVYLDVQSAADPQGAADALQVGLPIVTGQDSDSPLKNPSLYPLPQRGEGKQQPLFQRTAECRPHSGTDALPTTWGRAETSECESGERGLGVQGAVPSTDTPAGGDGTASPSPGIRASHSCPPSPTRGEGLLESIDDPVWRGKRVMIYTDLPGIYGVGQYNHALLCDLARRGTKAFCVQTKDDNPLVREREGLGVEHVWLSYHTRREFERTFTDTQDPKKLFKKHRPDLIVFSNCSPRSNLAAKRVALQRGIPFVVAESYVPAELIPLPQWTKECDTQLATQYRAARQVIAVSRENLNLLREQYGLAVDKGVVIHYGRPAEYFGPRDEAARKRLRTEFAIPDEAMLSLTAARLDPVKGYQYQLRALARLKESDVWPKLYFAWAGAGPSEADLREGVLRLGVADHVRILGERNDILDWLSAADCFVLTSKAEGMPICVMEAMAKGLPVAATSVSGTPEELGDTGCLLPDPNTTPADEVAMALVNVLEAWALNGDLRVVEGRRCHLRAQAMFRLERMLEETRACLARALALTAKGA